MSSITNKYSEKFPWSAQRARGTIAILYAVGIIGTMVPVTREIFIFLTPFILLISIAFLIYFHRPGFDLKPITVFLLICLTSFFVEVAGVRTGVIFGSYSYGKGLGLKLLETPLLIGLNWVLLVYCTAAISEKLPGGVVIKVLGASLLMVIYDLIMEQVAPDMDMWSFEKGFAPVRNYVSWFVLALVFHTGVRVSGIRITNTVAPFIFYCQTFFFLILLIFFKIVR